jgi:hypothetical protein
MNREEEPVLFEARKTVEPTNWSCIHHRRLAKIVVYHLLFVSGLSPDNLMPLSSPRMNRSKSHRKGDPSLPRGLVGTPGILRFPPPVRTHNQSCQLFNLFHARVKFSQTLDWLTEQNSNGRLSQRPGVTELIQLLRELGTFGDQPLVHVFPKSHEQLTGQSHDSDSSLATIALRETLHEPLR